MQFLPAIGAAVVWGLYSALTKVILFDRDFMGVIYGISAAIMYGLHMLMEPRAVVEAASLLIVALLGFNALSYSFWDYGMKKGDVTFLASVSYLIPFFSTLLLVLFGRGEMTDGSLIGGGMIIAGCLISNFARLRRSMKRHTEKKAVPLPES